MPAKGAIPEAVTEALDALKASINEFSVDFTSKLDTITTKHPRRGGSQQPAEQL